MKPLTQLLHSTSMSSTLNYWQQIHQTLHLCPLIVDKKDWSSASLVFMATATASYNGFLVDGNDLPGIITSLEEGTKTVTTQHNLGTTVINIDENAKTASSTVYVFATLFKEPQEKVGEVVDVNGYYEDQLVKGPEGWRIQKREFSLMGPGLSGDLSVVGK